MIRNGERRRGRAVGQLELMATRKAKRGYFGKSQCKSGGKAILSLPVSRSRALNEGASETTVEFDLQRGPYVTIIRGV